MRENIAKNVGNVIQVGNNSLLKCNLSIMIINDAFPACFILILDLRVTVTFLYTCTRLLPAQKINAKSCIVQDLN